MGDILQYIEWRGDLSLSQSSFNDVDNLILSMLSYMDLSGVVPTPGHGVISLRAAANMLIGDENPPEPEKPSNSEATLRRMLRIMGDSVRFGSMLLSDAVDILDTPGALQFFAMCVHIEPGRLYLAFRGTADELAGWKEDFLLACEPEIPSQHEAVNYISHIATAYPDCEFLLGGHSKGGNLAVYAAAFAPQEAQQRISCVWSNDGPGFMDQLINADGYARIASRVRKIVPKSSVVGMLLTTEPNFTIVDSDQIGLMQHDGFSWRVAGGRFVELKALTSESVQADKTIRSFIYQMSVEQRRQFVDCLFDVLYASGANTLSDVRRDRLRAALASLSYVREIPREHRERIFEFLILLRQITRRLAFESRLNNLRRNE